VTGAAAVLAYPIGGWMYGRQAMMPFWSSAILMATAIVVTVAVRAYFHANCLKPGRAERDSEEILPRAA